MSAPSILAQQLALAALDTAATESEAINGLIVGAAIILTKRFGGEVASAMLLEMAIEAHVSLSSAGMTAEPTRH
ncbi:hypothetical protein GCM10011380_15510 [Sphingomonas metalli]|uniref:Uncharacterized protein n=1 Tax=Sphingomonas metalli TaxID=1779358 RepID=A0A916WSM2_9SPHN|nr:hypothetical protein [Sphingomonas metalli]GGB26848.1 hypothetical protein GCM10011380_15510 [Sphingomonas metalli]